MKQIILGWLIIGCVFATPPALYANAHDRAVFPVFAGYVLLYIMASFIALILIRLGNSK